MKATIKDYLERLREEETEKPVEERRDVPTLHAISKKIGIHYTNISKLANGRAKALKFSTAIKIIDYMRSLGFDMKLSDLINYP